jgi:hypothetical protein
MDQVKSVTDQTNHRFGDTLVLHQIHDTSTGFAHRLCVGQYSGDWVGYEFIAQLNYDQYKFRAAMDTWQPMFSEVFLMKEGKRIS